MEKFWAFVIWTAFTCSAAYGMGNLLAADDLTRDCANKKEIVVKDSVIACEITHKIINGRRAALEQPQ